MDIAELYSIEIHWSIFHFQWVFKRCITFDLMKLLRSQEPQTVFWYLLENSLIEFNQKIKNAIKPTAVTHCLDPLQPLVH